MQSNHKNTFMAKHDSMSSQLIAKQWGLTIWSPWDSNTKISTKNDNKYWYLANKGALFK
jgi:hypothetical protein